MRKTQPKTLSDQILDMAAKRNDPDCVDVTLDQRLMVLKTVGNSELIDAVVLLQTPGSLKQFFQDEKNDATEVLLKRIDLSEIPKQTAGGRFLARMGLNRAAEWLENIGCALQSEEIRSDLKACASVHAVIGVASLYYYGVGLPVFLTAHAIGAGAGIVPLAMDIHNVGKLRRLLQGGDNLSQSLVSVPA